MSECDKQADDLRLLASRSVAVEQDLAATVLIGGGSRKASFSGVEGGYRLQLASKAAVVLFGEGDFSFSFALKNTGSRTPPSSTISIYVAQSFSGP